MTRLVFRAPSYTGGTVRLVFGADAVPDVPPVSVDIDVVLGGPTVSVVCLYDNRLPMRVSTSASTRWGLGQAASGEPMQRWQAAAPASGEPASPWTRGVPASGEPATRWQSAQSREHEVRTDWTPGRSLARDTALRYVSGTPVAAASAIRWAPGRAVLTQALMPYTRGLFVSMQIGADTSSAAPRSVVVIAPWTRGRHEDTLRRLPWGMAIPVPPGFDAPPSPEEPPEPPREVSTRLVFTCPPGWLGDGPVRLVFGRVCTDPVGPLAPLYILPARYFMQVHSLVAHRLPDLADVPIFDVSLSADAGSYAWTFSASAPVSVFDQLAPVSGLPQQIRITLDGIPFLFVVDSLQHEEAFGRRSVRISGRSITALIGSPFSRSTQWINTSGAATAQQLALQALDLSGVALSWGLEDWLVPAGAWSHSGTPLSAVQAIVEAAGGYLQSARNAATLIAMHPYPTLTGGVLGGPWNWYASGVVPDVELAPDALVTTAIERIDGADINAVYVSGETQGVSRLVKRTGTAANKLASPVVSALITADEVARQRGTAILGAAGPKHMVRATLPLLTGPSQPGILDVGQLIQVNAAQPWRGRVRSVSVAASFGAEVRQSVQIERHLEPA